MTPADQVHRLIDAGVADAAGVSAATLAAHAEGLAPEPGATLAVHPSLVPARRLAPLLRHLGQPGFVVADLSDLEEFVPIPDVAIPDQPLYLVHDISRGDELRNRSPKEALAAITDQGRTPLTISEGISWLLQAPRMLEPNYCFMTVGSRKPKGGGLDARTPAIWISGGTGHDGIAHRGAPKIGWCWAGNRHTWLGFASARDRLDRGRTSRT